MTIHPTARIYTNHPLPVGCVVDAYSWVGDCVVAGPRVRVTEVPTGPAIQPVVRLTSGLSLWGKPALAVDIYTRSFFGAGGWLDEDATQLRIWMCRNHVFDDADQRKLIETVTRLSKETEE